MPSLFTWLARRRYPYEPLISVEISKGNLLHNLNEFRKIAPHHAVAPVLKSNAYGHGLFIVADILKHDKTIPFFVVDSYFEAIALRSHGIRTPLLIIGYTRPETIIDSRLKNVMFTVTSLETLQALESVSDRVAINLKIDTGMRRQGILPEECDEAATLIAENPYIVLKGVCSHLSDADNADPSFTESQIHIWNRIAKKFKTQFSSLDYIHLANTDGHRYTSDIAANVSRLGLGLYGLMDGATFMPRLDLRPILEMKTMITGIKKLHRDETVGYGNSFKAQKEMTIATIPVGYYEGIDCRLSNNGVVEVGDEHVHCPIVGRVSMNITTVDISHVPNVKVGSPVTVISNNPSLGNSIHGMAERGHTIGYEIAVHIPGHLRRVVVE
jgi:alanine racemase